jgi:uncharacterized protein (UPF0147 family)
MQQQQQQQQQADHTSTPDLFNSVPYTAAGTTTASQIRSSSNNANNNNNSGDVVRNFQQRKDQMMQNISSKWQNSKSSREQILKTTQQHGEQMKQGLQKMGTKLQQGTSSTTNNNQVGLTDQLEMFNERMKEEVLRRDVRREAEEACLQTMRDHLSEFLQTTQTTDGTGTTTTTNNNNNNNNNTYEEWIFAFHPENTQDASLLHDMEYKEVDLRFFVEESDHRKLWNEMVNDPHREVAARTRMWSTSSSSNHPQNEQQPIVDLLGSEIPHTSQPPQPDVYSAFFDPFDDGTN